jgi:hypothetical protein
VPEPAGGKSKDRTLNDDASDHLIPTGSAVSSSAVAVGHFETCGAHTVLVPAVLVSIFARHETPCNILHRGAPLARGPIRGSMWEEGISGARQHEPVSN